MLQFIAKLIFHVYHNLLSDSIFLTSLIRKQYLNLWTFSSKISRFVSHSPQRATDFVFPTSAIVKLPKLHQINWIIPVLYYVVWNVCNISVYKLSVRRCHRRSWFDNGTALFCDGYHFVGMCGDWVEVSCMSHAKIRCLVMNIVGLRGKCEDAW